MMVDTGWTGLMMVDNLIIIIIHYQIPMINH